MYFNKAFTIKLDNSEEIDRLNIIANNVKNGTITASQDIPNKGLNYVSVKSYLDLLSLDFTQPLLLVIQCNDGISKEDLDWVKTKRFKQKHNIKE